MNETEGRGIGYETEKDEYVIKLNKTQLDTALFGSSADAIAFVAIVVRQAELQGYKGD